jgi:uncharacterized coiled-coil protein SlyX
MRNPVVDDELLGELEQQIAKQQTYLRQLQETVVQQQEVMQSLICELEALRADLSLTETDNSPVLPAMTPPSESHATTLCLPLLPEEEILP